jgi:hypothetical protein
MIAVLERAKTVSERGETDLVQGVGTGVDPWHSSTRNGVFLRLCPLPEMLSAGAREESRLASALLGREMSVADSMR